VVRGTFFAALLLLVLPARASLAAARTETRSISPPRATEAAPAGQPARSASPAASRGSWLSTLGALGLVLALILAAAYVVRRGMPGQPASLPAEALAILGRKALDHRHGLHLVRLGARVLLLGTSQQGLTTLAEVSEPAEVEALVALCRSKAGLGGGFAERLARWRGTDVPEAALPGTAEPMALRLKDLMAPVANVPQPGDAAAAVRRAEAA